MADGIERTFATVSDTGALEEGLAFAPRFNSDGLIPAIVSDTTSGLVLMFAWMNAHALGETLSTGEAHFWSRSRGKLWKKGEESGNIVKVVEVRTDCDQDVLWLRGEVVGDGVACHTKRRTCFYRAVNVDPSDVTASTLRLVEE